MKLEIEINGKGLECDVDYKWDDRATLTQDHQDDDLLVITKLTYTDENKQTHDLSDILAIDDIHDSIAEDLERELILEGE